MTEVDWQTCFALNARLDETAVSWGNGSATVRQLWGDPSRVVERRALPGMIVAHIVVETADGMLLVCQRQSHGIHDEAGTWSLSIEERWSGELYELRDREGHISQEPRPADRHPHEVVRRAVHEELGLHLEDADIRVLSWGLETSMLYPGFIALARTSAGSWEVEGLRANAPDANEVRFITSVPARLESLALLDEEKFAPHGRPELANRWHRTAKARLFAALAHRETRDGHDGRELVLARLGHQQ